MKRTSAIRMFGGAGAVGLALAAGLVATGANPGGAARSATFVHEVALDHPADAVWRAITRKRLVDRYYLAPLDADITAVGDRVDYGPPGRRLISGVVIAFEAPKRLEHSFRFEDEADKLGTVVTYRLTATAAGTTLRIEHRGYATDSQGYADIAGGWPLIAGGLKKLLDGSR